MQFVVDRVIRSGWAIVPALLVSTVAGSWSTSFAQDATPPAGVTVGVAEHDPVYIACDENVKAADGSDATPIPAVSPATVYTLDATQSRARYIAQEELAGTGAATAIGETDQIIGSFYFDAEGMPLACSRVDVDLRTLTSDKSKRDNWLRGETLQTDTYPIATFVVTSVAGLEGALVDGQETTIYLTGNLTFHGVTRQATWEGTVTLSGDSLTGNASTTFELDDFDITKPIVGPVLSIDDTIELQIDIVATKAA